MDLFEPAVVYTGIGGMRGVFVSGITQAEGRSRNQPEGRNVLG
jgi:hypothetical protein